MVNAHVAALAGHLGGEHDEPAPVHPFPQAVAESALFRQAAHAEALDDKGVVPLQKEVHSGAVLARRQLQKGHLGVQGIAESRDISTVLPDIPQEDPVPQDPQVRVVDAGKGLEALGAGLPGPGAQDHMAVEHDGHPRQVRCGTAEGIRQVDLGIGGVKADGLLGSGEDDGLGAALDQIAEGRGGIGHGVCAVGDDKAVITVIVIPDAARHSQPMLRPHVGAVQVQQLHAVHIADAGDGRQMAQKLLRGQFRRQAVLRHIGGDGAAGADKQNFLHRTSFQPRSRWSRAARPNRAAMVMRRRSSSVPAQFSWVFRSFKNKPRRESSSARAHRSSASRVWSRSSRA